MQKTLITKEEIEYLKHLYVEYRPLLKANRKTGEELVDYLSSRYALTPCNDSEALGVIYANVMENACYREKLSAGAMPDPSVFFLNRNGREIFVGVDLNSGFFCVEEDEELWDELCAYQGLDEMDLENYYSVGMYVSCCQKCGWEI